MVLICLKLNPHYPWMLCAKFGWNWPSRFKKILQFRQCFFCYFNILCTCKRAWPLLEQTWIPFNSVCFVPSLVEISPVVLEKKIFKFFQYIFAISLKRVWLLNKFEFPSPRMLCAKFGWNWTSGFGEEDENGRSLQTDGQENGQRDRRLMTGDQKRSLELSA